MTETSSNTEIVEYKLENVIIGNQYTMIQGSIKNDENNNGQVDLLFSGKEIKIENSDNSIDENSYYLNSNSPLNFSYFMKNNTSIKIISSLNENKFKDNLSGNLNSLYYDQVIQNLSGINYAQINNRYYFINKNMFQGDNVISGKYDLNHILSGINMYEMVKNHISKRYNNNFYNNSLKYANDKSIPIYDLDYKALNNVDVLKFQNQNIINSIISDIDNLIDSKGYKVEKISDFKSKILYNSKTDRFDEGEYDSILIIPIVEKYSEKQELLNKIFEYIFSNLSIDSFYRLLIPVGKINKISNDQTSGIVFTNDYEEYSYYVNVDNIKKLSDEISFNYFNLKNLKNPHDEYDYEIHDINDNLTCHSDVYSLSGSEIYKILNFTDSALLDLKKYIGSSHAGVMSGQYIENHNLSSLLISATKARYSNWSEEIISANIIKEGTWIRYISFNNYFRDTYDKILSEEPYLISKNDVLSYWNLKIQSYENEFKDELYNNDFYLSGLNIFNEISGSILNIFKNNTNTIKSTDEILSSFLESRDAEIIEKDLNKLSNTQTELMSIFNPGLYKSLAINILNKNDVNDRISAQEEWYKDRYSDRFSIKLNDYKNIFNYYYNHENIMKKDGYIFGFRKYNFINKSFSNKLFLTYNYFTSHDYEFLERHNLISSIILEDYNENFNYLNENEFLDENISGFNINDQKSCKLINSNKEEFLSYMAMLLKIREFEFIDFLDGEYKYKEMNKQKSNVYSIELKNSNLNYNTINFDEMKAICEIKLNQLMEEEEHSISSYFYNEDDESFYENNEDKNLISGFLDIVHSLGYKEILDITMNEDMEILKKTNYKIPVTSYKFYNINDELNSNIHTKMEVRKQLEKAIRKSIGRYAPINTTLWKIKYTGL